MPCANIERQAINAVRNSNNWQTSWTFYKI
jgi:hypothetical protein